VTCNYPVFSEHGLLFAH